MSINTHSFVTTLSPAPSPHRALAIPEILEAILGYCLFRPMRYPSPLMPQKPGADRLDIHRELRYPWWTPLLVSKNWLSIGMVLYGKTISWHCEHDIDTDSLEMLLAELRDSKVLRLSFASASQSNHFSRLSSTVRTTRWAALHETLKGVYAAEQSKTVTRADSDVSRLPCIRDLIMESIVPIADSKTTALNILDLDAFSCQLTTLSLHFSGRTEIALHSIVDRLPLLRHLSLENAFLQPVPSEWSFKRTAPSRLRTLRLLSIAYTYHTIRKLAHELCGLELEMLQLGYIGPSGAMRFGASGPIHIDMHLLNDISLRSPKISSVTLVCVDEVTVQRLFNVIIVFPYARDVRIMRGDSAMAALLDDAPPRSMPYVASSGSRSRPGKAGFRRHLVITRLGIENNNAVNKSDMQSIQDFLCSPDAVYLKELVAPRYSICYMDAQNPSYSRWTCRDLEVLALRFESLSRSMSPSSFYRDLAAHYPRLRLLLVHDRLSGMS